MQSCITEFTLSLLCLTCNKIHEFFIFEIASVLKKIVAGLGQMQMDDWESFSLLKRKVNTCFSDIMCSCPINKDGL